MPYKSAHNYKNMKYLGIVATIWTISFMLKAVFGYVGGEIIFEAMTDRDGN